MSIWKELCIFFVFFAVAWKSVESALAFTRQPVNPTYVVKGLNASLVWEYSVGNRTKELLDITWRVVDRPFGNLIAMIFETKDGNRSFSRNIPAAYKGRVSIDKSATLVIQEVTLDDSRAFNCRVRAELDSGAHGITSTVLLIVTVPPTVSVVPVVRYVNVGDAASFTCTGSGIPTPNMTWYRSGKQVTGSHYEIVSITATSSQLTIKNISYDDGGYYDCQATSNEMEPGNSSFFLGVIKDAEKDNALCPKTTYEAKVGDKIALCCPVSANPPPEVEWMFDGVKVEKSLATTLVIPYVNDSNYGSYYCTARSLEGAVGPFGITLNKTKFSSIEVEKAIQPNTIEWKKVEGAKEYLVRISGTTANCSDSLLGQKQATSLEIPHSTLQCTGKEQPPSVEVNIEVLAVDENGVIGKGQLQKFTIKKTSGATNSGISFISVIVLFMMGLSLQ